MLTIRPCAEQDRAAAAALLRGACPGNAAEAVARLDARPAAWVVSQARQLIGYGAFWRVQDVRFRADLAVHPAQRGRGVGNALLATLVREARAVGACTLQVRADSRDARTLRFFLQRGFEETMRMHQQALDLQAVCGEALAAADVIEGRLLARGIAFTSLREAERQDASCWAKLAALEHAAHEGWPDPDPGAGAGSADGPPSDRE